jgi:antitoxin HicB
MKKQNTNTKDIKDYLKEPYTRVIVPEQEGGFSAEILEFPGCFACGDTIDETYSSLEEAAYSWIEAASSQGQEIPSPMSHQEYSGKIALRIPRARHRQAVLAASREGVSLNQFLLDAIAEKLGANNFFSRMAQYLENRFFRSMEATNKERASIPFHTLGVAATYERVQFRETAETNRTSLNQ